MKRMGHRPRIDTNAPQPGEPWQNRRCSAVVVIVVLVVLAVLVVLVVVVVVAPVRYIACFGHLCIQGSPQTSLFGWSWLLRILFWLVRTGAPAHLYPWWTRLHDQDCPISEPFDARNLLVGAASGLLAQTAEHTVGFLICR